MGDTTLTPINGATPALTNEKATRPTTRNVTAIAPVSPYDLFKDRVSQTPAFAYLAGLQTNGTGTKADTDQTGQVQLNGKIPSSIDVNSHTKPTSTATSLIIPPGTSGGFGHTTIKPRPALLAVNKSATRPAQAGYNLGASSPAVIAAPAPAQQANNTSNNTVASLQNLLATTEATGQTTQTGTAQNITPSNEVMTASKTANNQSTLTKPNYTGLALIAGALALIILTK